MSHAHQAQQTKSKENQGSPHALAAVKWLEDAGELRKEKPSQNQGIHMLLVNVKLLGKSRYEVIPRFIRGKAKDYNNHSSSLWAMKNAAIRV